jgi:protein-arginine deiminase
MKLARFSALACALSLVACADAPFLEGEKSTSSNEPDPETAVSELGNVVADLRADTNRDGVIRFDDPSDDDNEHIWNAQQGAIFLANIDDDESACSPNVDDVDLPKCHDAADDLVNGPDDELDLARLKTKPWPAAPPDATGTITWTAANKVRLFKKTSAGFTVIQSGATLSRAEIQRGVELAIEGRDIVRDLAEWDGYVDVTFSVTADGETARDSVRMRVAPLLTYHHLLPAEQTWVSRFTNPGNAAMRADLVKAAQAAGVEPPIEIGVNDPWTQDFFETGFMSMPAPDGKQHVIRVNIRSANMSHGAVGGRNPLRPAGRVVFHLRGKDSAAIQAYDPTRLGQFDTLNSFGNFETVPPYSFNGTSYPLGRVLRGSTPNYYPDRVFTKMMEAQLVQPPIYLDTSWLLVGHVDETLSFVKASTPRGWVLLVNDARMAWQMLRDQAEAGRGNVPMFVGKYWSDGTPARVTINQVLSDREVASASAEAAVEVDAQVAKLKAEIGLTDDEIIPIPFLHMELDGYSVAYQPGMVNGLYMTDRDFVAPDPHGPVIGGQDIFKVAMREALAPLGINVHFAEDWDTYHRMLGEVHCGTNATRAIPSAKWWESGR